MNKPRLTKAVRCGGCAGKINPSDLFNVISKLSIPSDKKLLAGLGMGEDACVYQLSRNKGLIFTTDFIAPIVDDPFNFGRIAATNALSDIFAMGGKPLMALNIVFFDERFDYSVLEQILQGGNSVCNEMSTLLCGGHSVKAPELRYGLAIVGEISIPKMRNVNQGKVGEILYLTKALGTGILSQAIKYDLLDEQTHDLLIRQLCELNNSASQILSKYQIKMATDVSGFGLLGDLLKITKASNCSAELILDNIPCLPNVLNLSNDRVYSGIIQKNKFFVEDYVTSNILRHKKSNVLLDPQTSGGLLFSVNEDKSHIIEAEFKQKGLEIFKIGKFTTNPNFKIFAV